MLACLLPLRAPAAVSLGVAPTNSEEAERLRASQFWEAEKSYSDMLQVGRERYEQRQAQRNEMIAGMQSELASHQALVTVPSEPSKTGSAVQDSEPPSHLWEALLFLALLFVVYRHYQSRRNADPSELPSATKRVR